MPDLDRFISEHEPWVAPEALDRLQQIREEHARAAGLVALSAATDADLDDLVPLTLGGELKPFQRAGVEYLLKQRRSFLADEQGLGKTWKRWRRSRRTVRTRRSSCARPA